MALGGVLMLVLTCLWSLLCLEFSKHIYLKGKLLIVAPDDTCGVRTLSRDPDALSRLYEKGLRDGEKIPAFLD